MASSFCCILMHFEQRQHGRLFAVLTLVGELFGECFGVGFEVRGDMDMTAKFGVVTSISM